jgi:hypothetical protein
MVSLLGRRPIVLAAIEPRIATRQDFAEIIGSLPAFWGERDVAHLHHPTAIVSPCTAPRTSTSMPS